MKRMLLLWAALICLLLSPFQALADEAPYYTLTETYDGKQVYSQNGYLPEKTYYEFDEKALKRPAAGDPMHPGWRTDPGDRG